MMLVRMVVMMILAVVVDGATVEAPSDLKCYKKTTDWDNDFTCTWKPGASGSKPNYTLNYCTFDMQIKNYVCKHVDAGQKRSVVLLIEDLWNSRYCMWVDANANGSKHSSANFSMVLQDQVQYDAPHMERISRSLGNLTLLWRNPPKENEPVINEIQFRGRGEQSWQSKSLKTSGENKLEEHTLRIEKSTVYKMRVRRRANITNLLWSAWSKTYKVPTEIRKQPEVKWKVGELKSGVRLLTLNWTAPSEEESVGGVKYILSLVIMPCKPEEPKTIHMNTTEYRLNVTASAVDVTILAMNNVGQSPKHTISIPALHLENCPKDQDEHVTKESCVEWYELTGNTRTGPVNHKTNGNISQIAEGLKDFVRYHYFVHIKKGKDPQTISMCPFYKTEGVPKQGPPNVTTVDVTHNSVLVSWQPIPITHLQGFLKNYVIYITGGNHTDVVNVSQFQTSYTIQSLTPGTLYTVNVAGETTKGVGPNTTQEILLNPQQGLLGLDWMIVGLVAGLLALTVFCSFVVKRLKHKLLPEIPTPTITETPVNRFRSDEGVYPVGEELHPVVLVHDLPGKSSTPPPLLEEHPLLEECETTLGDDEGEETQADPDAFEISLPLSSDYKRQVLSAPEITELSQEQVDCEVTSPVYRKGLVLENTPEINTQL
ncbi:interleukin-12 receptor subunit beta-1 isoform X1 [Conger conger]|uniref:interleukin-12 receptor subunit beta-1 isoform X1 n=3 Tax=Conger conger TaxID=82655 RepID=UPI002A5A65BF|nr:interleukin-12 receptor subunit beta-1 isoform X1 [Conger conger]